jgi:hypothetical protein
MGIPLRPHSEGWSALAERPRVAAQHHMVPHGGGWTPGGPRLPDPPRARLLPSGRRAARGRAPPSGAARGPAASRRTAPAAAAAQAGPLQRPPAAARARQEPALSRRSPSAAGQAGLIRGSAGRSTGAGQPWARLRCALNAQGDLPRPAARRGGSSTGRQPPGLSLPSPPSLPSLPSIPLPHLLQRLDLQLAVRLIACPCQTQHRPVGVGLPVADDHLPGWGVGVGGAVGRLGGRNARRRRRAWHALAAVGAAAGSRARAA